MEYIESPNKYQDKRFKMFGDQEGKCLFLGGGITNCPQWQKEVITLLKNTDLIVFNPRRENFPIKDPNASYEQIQWEYDHFELCKLILFWFSRGSLNPIVLFEYGRWSYISYHFFQFGKKVFVGIDPEYERKQDVEIQTKLLDPTEKVLKIVYSLEELANQIIEYRSQITYNLIK